MGTIIKELEMLASITSGKQKQMFEDMIAFAQEVKMTPITDVFSKEQIAYIEKYIKPKKKECYKNATQLCWAFPGQVEYCEGKFTCYGISIDHAFNKVGDKYVDITKELVLGGLDEETEYVVLGTYNAEEVRRVAVETGYYGDVYRLKYIEKMTENHGELNAQTV